MSILRGEARPARDRSGLVLVQWQGGPSVHFNGGDAMDRPTCKTCVYWDALEDDNEGWCHRYPAPPAVTKVMIEEIGMYDAVRVVMQSTDWCGEHPDFPEYIKGLKPKPSARPIDMDNLSIRARNIIREVTKVTGKSVLELTDDDLYGVRNCGSVTRGEIMNFILARGDDHIAAGT